MQITQKLIESLSNWYLSDYAHDQNQSHLIFCHNLENEQVLKFKGNNDYEIDNQDWTNISLYYFDN